MATVASHVNANVRVCSLEDLRRDGRRVFSVQGRTVLVLLSEGEVYALDNRCPHMGFPLSRGTIKDGILTCHWHHAKFDLAGGCTFDPFADDVTSFHAEVRDGDVWIDPIPIEEDRRVHWTRKLDEGLEHNVRLVLAKAVIGLYSVGSAHDAVRQTALFGVRNRSAGWSSGMSILTAMANVLPHLAEEDRPLALFHGIIHVASDTANEPPSFDLEPLETSEQSPERYMDWFRRFVNLRSTDAAERTLRTAVHIGFDPGTVADIVNSACTDHLFLGEGHSLDFANKSFELLDHVGWEHAEEVLPSLVPGDNMVAASRMEESASWRHPVDLASLLDDLYGELDDLITRGASRANGWNGRQELGEMILDAEPHETLQEMAHLLADGAHLSDLSASVAYAAARRPVHFRVTNEFADWDTVHHTFTYANAVDQAMRRSPSSLLARGIFDGAMSVYLERFLNVPKQTIPVGRAGNATAADLLDAFDAQGHVDETGQIVADMLAGGNAGEVIRTMGHALLREDAGFHMFQIYEAAVRQYGEFARTPAGDHILIGAARFLSAHSPTVRATGQTYDIAARLLRGESLHGEDE